MVKRPLFSPHFTSLLQLAGTLLVGAYMILIGGSFNATVSYRVQLLNAIVASVIAIIWVSRRAYQRKSLIATSLEIPLALFVGSQWLSVISSAQPRISVEGALTTTAWVLAFIVLGDLLANGWPKITIENTLILTAAFITVQALLEISNWFISWLKLGLFPLVAYRVVGFLGHPNLTTAALNLLLPLVIVRFIRTPNRLLRIGLIILVIGMLTVEFFTSSRSGWVGLAALLMTLFGLGFLERTAYQYIQPWRMRWKSLSSTFRRIIYLAIILFGAGLGYLLWQETLHASHPEFFSSRQYIWGPAWDNFLAQPVLGSGVGLYTWYYPKYASIPPEWLAPHAHSILFQILGESGIVGVLAGLILLGSAGYLFWKRWNLGTGRLWTAAFISIAVGWFVHHLFDYLFGTPAFTFLFIVIAALAFDLPASERPAYRYHPLYLVLPLAGLIGLGIFFLRASALNDQGLSLVNANKWPEAAATFEQAAQADPGLTLYWQNAAYANTRAGNLSAALPLWQRASLDDPYWPLLPATLGVLQPNRSELQTANILAPHSDLFALNLGVLDELAGDENAARENYQRALTLKPGSVSALFWQQTSLRKKILLDWKQNTAPPATSLENGQQALLENQTEQAIQFFKQAQTQYPLSNAPYLGLARATWQVGDEPQAQRYFKIAQLIPTVTLDETLDLYLFQGDWAEAHGDQASASNAYKIVFSIINDYTSSGPGTYGYPERSWLVYHRPAPPSDLILQFAHDDVTPQLDERFAKLTKWLSQAGDTGTACYIANRVYREAPDSQSGQLWVQLCH
jgi:tetratricopeptide (TPR) repeat protein/O-antigen ligase